VNVQQSTELKGEDVSMIGDDGWLARSELIDRRFDAAEEVARKIQSDIDRIGPESGAVDPGDQQHVWYGYVEFSDVKKLVSVILDDDARYDPPEITAGVEPREVVDLNPFRLIQLDLDETNIMAQPMLRREDGTLAPPLTLEEVTEAMRRAGADESDASPYSQFVEAIGQVIKEREALLGTLGRPEADGQTSITLTRAEAQALWDDSQDDVDRLGRYWEHPSLAALVARLKRWHNTESW
jgi:hypothetical protein